MARILIIDDDIDLINILREILERAGHEVAAALNGKEGMKKYREGPVDLVMTDLIMPEREGLETIMELRRDFPGIKIIAMSGGGRSGEDHYLQMAKRLGAQQTLSKPFRVGEVLQAVEDLLSQ